MSRGEQMFYSLLLHIHGRIVPRIIERSDFVLPRSDDSGDESDVQHIGTIDTPKYEVCFYEFCVFHATLELTRLLRATHEKMRAGFLEKWTTYKETVYIRYQDEEDPETEYRSTIYFPIRLCTDGEAEIDMMYRQHGMCLAIVGNRNFVPVAYAKWRMPGGTVYFESTETRASLELHPRATRPISRLGLEKRANQEFATVRDYYANLVPRKLLRIAEKFGFVISPVGELKRESNDRNSVSP